MYATAKLRLRQSVGIVSHNQLVEFFKSNVRDSLKLQMDYPEIVELLKKFDGIHSITEVHEQYQGIEFASLVNLLHFLTEHHVLIEQDALYPQNNVMDDYRIINILEDFFTKTSDVINALASLENSRVMVIGLGAVGSLIAAYLAKSKVGSFILVDSDTVDISNLHRQYYFENEVGHKKGVVLSETLKAINNNINVELITANIDTDFFDIHSFPHIDLIINCADEPSVDFTSHIIAHYSMKHKIPHIVGGGYNLHLTLIGQSIIPYSTACFKCFKTKLEQLNSIDLKNVKKLHRKNRKLGSFSPLSGIAANLASLDAFKILIKKYDTLQQTNKRIEFNMKEHKFNTIEIARDPHCEWCSHE